jgi:RHS repeat-associated protein
MIGKAGYNGIGYTGHVIDGATGLTYMQQRYYDQSIGRFLSVDPVTANPNTGVMFNRYSYAYNNPYTFNDPDGRKGKIGWAVELGTGTMRKIARATYEEAVKIRRSGGNFLGDSTRISRKVGTNAHGRSGRLRQDGHSLKDDSGNVVGKGFPHYQTDGVEGHSFINKTVSVILAIGAAHLNQQADALDSVAEVADNIDPYKIGDAGVKNECASSCGVSDIQQEKARGQEGFRGTFRIGGRIESKQLSQEKSRAK